MARTLCDWDKRDIEREVDKLAAIIGTPRFVCRKCARSAQDERYLCKPTRLPARAANPPVTPESLPAPANLLAPTGTGPIFPLPTFPS